MTPLQKAERKIIQLESKLLHIEKRHVRETAKINKKTDKLMAERNEYKAELDKHNHEAIMTPGWLKVFALMRREVIESRFKKTKKSA